jgi:hypothetical protein
VDRVLAVTASSAAGYFGVHVVSRIRGIPGGENPSNRPSTGASERSGDRPASVEPDAARSREPDRTTEPAETTRPPAATAAVTSEPTRTTRTSRPAETTAGPRGSTAAAAPEPTPTAQPSNPAETIPTPVDSASAVAATDTSQGPGTWGWLLLIVLVAALVVGGLLVYRSQRRSAWDTEARALDSETRTIVAIRLPAILSTASAGPRGQMWPPVRAALGDVQGRWHALTDRAVGEARRNWSLRLSGLLQELIAAVDAENEALAAGRDWMLLRPRVNQAEQALTSVLTAQGQPEPPPTGEPGPSAFQT